MLKFSVLIVLISFSCLLDIKQLSFILDVRKLKTNKKQTNVSQCTLEFPVWLRRWLTG